MAKHFFRIILTAVIFGFLAVLLGFVIDFIFSNPQGTESTCELIIRITFQIILGTLIIYYIDQSFESIFGIDSDTYFGLTIFGVLFFLVQQQLFLRLSILYQRLTGQNI